MDIQKIRTLLGLSADRPLSPEEKRRRIRYIVYPAMCLLFAGSLWLIYSPSEKERAAEEKRRDSIRIFPPPDSKGWTATRWTLMSVKNWRKRIIAVKCISGDGLAVRQFR